MVDNFLQQAIRIVFNSHLDIHIVKMSIVVFRGQVEFYFMYAGTVQPIAIC